MQLVVREGEDHYPGGGTNLNKDYRASKVSRVQRGEKWVEF